MATSARHAGARSGGSRARRALIEQLVREKAVEVFAARGYANTSLADIADAVGIGRTAIYHYYASKDDLLVALIEESAGAARQVLQRWLATSAEGNPLERLREAVRELALFSIDRPGLVRLLDTPAELPPEAQRAARFLNRTFFADLKKLIARGVESGHLREVDHGVAAHGIVGSTRSLVWWFDPSGERSAEFVADQLADTAVRGLAAHRVETIPSDIDTALDTLRAGIDSLQRSLRRERP